MGLDMYAYTRATKPPTEIDFVGDDEGEHLIATWRKHNSLHGWMEALYTSKGGVEQFNCVNMELTHEDLIELERAVEEGTLPVTGGFFFGADSTVDYIEHRQEEDREFLVQAFEAIERGEFVYYTSWW